MSTTIDNKVVSMSFDNKNFEKNVSKTMSTLDKFKQKLKFDKSAQGLEKLDKAAQKVRFDTVEHGIDRVKMKLSALDVFAVTAFHRMSDAAITTGKNLVKAFTIDPVKSGLQEYETQINAVQTILANTSHNGTTIDQVNKALDELNTYADKTIYNFTEMTRNIGTFTAAGLDLQTSTKAIQGIANLAAVSGSNAQQASTAMYQLSQALAAGSVHLQDWNSVVNAGMGGKVFQDAIIKTAKEMGALNDVTLKAYESGVSFRELLNPKDYGNWFNSDVLSTTLSKFTKTGIVEYMADFANVSQGSVMELQKLGDKAGYNSKEFKKLALSIANGDKAMADNITSALQMADTAENAATKVKTFTQLMDTLKEAAQSGWTQTWELIIGDFEEAKALFTEASDFISGIISESAENRNNLVKGAMQNIISSDDWAKFEKAGVATKAFKNAIIETAEANGIAVKQMIKDNGSFEESLKTGWLNKDILGETLKKNEKQLSASTLKMSKSMKEYFKIADQVMKGSWGKGREAQEALTKAGYDYAQVQNLINGMTKYGAKEFEKLCLSQLKSEGVTKKQAKALVKLAKQAKETGTPINELMQKMERKSGRELLIDTIRNSALAIIKPFKAMKKAWEEIFPPATSEDLYGIINALHEFSVKLDNIDKDGSKLTRTFKGVFSIFKLVTSIVGGGAKAAFTLMQATLKYFNLDILDVTASIGDFLTNTEKWIEKNDVLVRGVQFVAIAIGKLIASGYNLIDVFGKIPAVQNGISKFGKIFKEVLNIGNERLNEVGQRIDDFIERVKSLDNVTLDNIEDIFKDFKENVIDYIFDVGGRVDDVKGSFATLRENIRKDVTNSVGIIGYLKDVIIDFAVTIKDKLSKTDIFGPLLTIGTGIAIVKTVSKVSGAIEKIGSLLGGLMTPLQSINRALAELQPTLKAYAFKMKSEAIINIAKAIAILAGSLFILSKIQPDRLALAAGALVVMSAALGGLCIIMGKFKTLDIGKISSAMLGMSGALLVLVIALKKMDSLNPNNILRNLGVLGAILAGLTLFSLISSKMSTVNKGMASIVLFAIALRMLVNTMKSLDGMDVNNVKTDLLALSGMVMVLGKISKSAGSIKFTNGAGLILFVVALRMFIKTLSSIDASSYQKIQDNLGGIVVILGTFAILSAASQRAGKYAAKAGLMMLGISVSMLILVKVIKQISAISKDDLRNAAGAISGILLVFGAVIALSNFAGDNALKAGGMILMMSGAMLAISVVAAILSKLDPSGLQRATVSIGIIIGCFSLLVAASGLAEECKGTILAMTTAIGMLAIAIGALSFIDPEQLNSSVKAISTVMGMFALMTAATGLSKKSTTQLLMLVGVVGILATIISIITKQPLQSAIEAAGSISILMLSLTASMTLMSKVGKVSMTAIGALYAISGTVAILATIMGVMTTLNVAPSIETAAALSIMLMGMTAVCGALGLLGPLASGAISGALALDAVILVIGGLMVGLGALVDKIPCMETFLNKGIGLLNGIASGIGQFIGNIIGGIGEGATDHLPAIGKNLAGFADGISGVKPEVAEAAKALTQALLILGGAQIVDAVASWITGDASMEEFGSQMKAFGQGIADFSAVVDGTVNPELVARAAEAGKKIVELADMIPNSGGWLGAIVGNNDIEDFAPQMVKLGEGIVKFSNSIDGKINANAIEQATAAGEKIVELAKLVPKKGGWLSAITGRTDLASFAPQLAVFGQGIVDFSNTVSGNNINTSGVIEITEAGKKIIDLAKLVPKSGGWISRITGRTDLASFSPQLKVFGEGITEFSKSVDKKIKTKPIENATEAGKKIIDLANLVPKEGGWLENITGNKNIGKFGKKMKTFGNGIADFFNSSITSVPQASIKKASANTKSIVKVLNAYSEVDTSKIGKIPKTFDKVSKASVKNFTENFSESGKSVRKSVNTMLNAAKSEIQNRIKDFNTAGANCVNGFVKGIANKVNSGDVYGAGRRIGESALKGARESLDIHSPSRKMKEVAKYTVDGFTNFINSAGTKKAKKSSTKMMDTFSKTTQTQGAKGTKKATASIKKSGRTVTKAAQQVSAQFLSQIKTALTKAKKEYKAISNIDKVLAKKMKSYVNSAGKISTVTKYASGVINKFAKTYVTSTKNATKQRDKASKSVSKFIKNLYKESDAYKEDQKNLKDNLKALKKYQKEKVKILEKLSKVKSADKKKEYQQQLKENAKNIKETEKAIKQVKKTAEKNAKSLFNEMKKSIKDAVKDYVKIFNASAKEINLFDTSVFDSLASNTSLGSVTSVVDSLSNMMSIFDISLDVGADIFSKFSTSAEDSANAISEAEKNLADATNELTDARKELSDAEQELHNAQLKSASVYGRSQRYLDKIKEAEEKVAEARKKVTDATLAEAEANENLTKAKTDTSVEETLANMESNIKGIEELRKNLDELAKRGIDEKLLKSLKDLGTSGAEQVATFVKMTDEELKKANTYFQNFSKLSSRNLIDGFKDKNKAMKSWSEGVTKFSKLNIDDTVKSALLNEFQEQGVESAEYINTILNMTEDELKSFSNEYLEMLKVPDQVANEVIAAQKKVDEANKKNKPNAAKEYIATMEANLNAQRDYEKNLDKLKKKAEKGVISDGFYKYLKNLGYEGAETVAAFVNTTSDELKKANSLYLASAKDIGDSFIDSFTDNLANESTWAANMEKLTKLKLPKDIKEALYKDFEEQGIDGNAILEIILNFTPEQLKKFEKKYKEALAAPGKIANSIMAGMVKTDVTKIKKEVSKNITDVGKTTKTECKKVGEESTKAVSGGIINGKPKVKKAAKQVGVAITDTLSQTLSKSKISSIANGVCDTLASGISKGTSTIARAASGMSNTITDAMRKSVRKGLNGMTDRDETANRINSIVSTVASSISTDKTYTPTIRPVLDTSSLKSGISSANSLLNASSIAVHASMANRIGNAVNNIGRKGASASSNDTYDYSQKTIENHFNITGDNPREIANEVSKILQQQVDRRRAAWE